MPSKTNTEQLKQRLNEKFTNTSLILKDILNPNEKLRNMEVSIYCTVCKETYTDKIVHILYNNYNCKKCNPPKHKPFSQKEAEERLNKRIPTYYNYKLTYKNGLSKVYFHCTKHNHDWEIEYRRVFVHMEHKLYMGCEKCRCFRNSEEYKEEAIKRALNYNSLKDFRENELNYYDAASRMGFLDELMEKANLKRGNNITKRDIYEFHIFFENIEYVYVGLSYDVTERYHQHMKPDDNSIVGILCRKFGIIPLPPRIIAEGLDENDASLLEKDLILKYREQEQINPYIKCINRNSGGSLGLTRRYKKSNDTKMFNMFIKRVSKLENNKNINLDYILNNNKYFNNKSKVQKDARKEVEKRFRRIEEKTEQEIHFFEVGKINKSNTKKRKSKKQNKVRNKKITCKVTISDCRNMSNDEIKTLSLRFKDIKELVNYSSSLYSHLLYERTDLGNEILNQLRKRVNSHGLSIEKIRETISNLTYTDELYDNYPEMIKWLGHNNYIIAEETKTLKRRRLDKRVKYVQLSEKDGRLVDILTGPELTSKGYSNKNICRVSRKNSKFCSNKNVNINDLKVYDNYIWLKKDDYDKILIIGEKITSIELIKANTNFPIGFWNNFDNIALSVKYSTNYSNWMNKYQGAYSSAKRHKTDNWLKKVKLLFNKK